jgi:hypothetical protein
MDGIYKLTFRGAADWGIGLLELRDGIVAGADAAGATYDGTYRETDSDITLELNMNVPPGVALVQGSAPKSKHYSVPFHATIPKQAIDDGTPVYVDLPPGPVNVIVTRLREFVH